MPFESKRYRGKWSKEDLVRFDKANQWFRDIAPEITVILKEFGNENRILVARYGFGDPQSNPKEDRWGAIAGFAPIEEKANLQRREHDLELFNPSIQTRVYRLGDEDARAFSNLLENIINTFGQHLSRTNLRKTERITRRGDLIALVYRLRPDFSTFT